jgi:DNA-3-methyladenine glycosylase II
MSTLGSSTSEDSAQWAARLVDAERALAVLDAALATVIGSNGPLDPGRYRRAPFHALIRAVIGQQLSARAAASIAARVAANCGTDPARLARASVQSLRAAGLSVAKARTILRVAQAVASGALDLAAVASASPDDARGTLIAIPGIGPWTVDMFLMFGRAELDVFAPGDLGLRRAVQRLDALADLPAPDYCAARAERWQPWRTVACWHLWRWIEATPGLSPSP